VHPLDKLIHFTKRGGRYTPITSIDFMRMRAADTGELAGNDDPIYVFQEGETVLPQVATVTVYRLTQGQRFPYTASARWAEYKPPTGQDHMWLKMPQLMLGKCAEALALRKAFPKQLHGIYERAEMAQAGREDSVGRLEQERNSPKVLARGTGEVGSTSGPTDAGKETARVAPSPADFTEESQILLPTPDDDVERERIWTQIQQLSARILESKTTPKEKKQWTEDKAAAWLTNCGTATPSTADLSSLNDLKKWLETRQPK
jgi:hypothetical protein